MTLWPWISHIISVTTTTTTINVAVSTNDCCYFCISPELDPNLNMLQLLHILLHPATPKSLNVSSRNLHLYAVTVAYHENFSYDDPLHTLQIRRNNLHCTLKKKKFKKAWKPVHPFSTTKASQVLTYNVTDSSIFCYIKRCPSGWCVKEAHLVCRDTDILIKINHSFTTDLMVTDY